MYKTVADRQRNGQHRRCSRKSTSASKAGGRPSCATRCSSSAPSTRRWQTRTFNAPDGSPRLQSLGDADCPSGGPLSYSAKGDLAGGTGHRVDASFFGVPSKGEMGPQRTSSLLVTDTSSFSELDYGGHNQTVHYDGVYGSRISLLEASFARAYNKIAELPFVDAWRVTDTTVVPNIITGGIGGYEQGNLSTNYQYSAKATYLSGGHSVRVASCSRTSTIRRPTNAPDRRFTAADGRQDRHRRVDPRFCRTSTSARSIA